jgi:hypothetical protein
LWGKAAVVVEKLLVEYSLTGRNVLTGSCYIYRPISLFTYVQLRERNMWTGVKAVDYTAVTNLLGAANKTNNSVAWLCERTIPTERPPFVGEVSADYWGQFRMASAADPHGRSLGFIDRSRYVSLQVAPQLYSRGWVDPVPNPLLVSKSGNAGNTQNSGSVARNSDL